MQCQMPEKYKTEESLYRIVKIISSNHMSWILCIHTHKHTYNYIYVYI